MNFSLVLMTGPSQGEGVLLDPKSEPVTIGRDATRTLPIDDHACSRLHARVWNEGGNWHIEDCKSRNGTFVNKKQIERSMLRRGDVIRVGDRIMLFAREHDPAENVGWQPSRLATSTFVRRVADPEKRDAIVAQLRENLNSPPALNAAVLCKLASSLYKHDHVESLVQNWTAAIVEGTKAATVIIWLVGPDGRLRPVGGTEDQVKLESETDHHVLASLSVENNEALLVQEDPGDSDGEATIEDAFVKTDSAISAPIPGRGSRRGAIECFTNASFTEHDLNLVTAIAHLGGLALENIEHREQLELANQQLRESLTVSSRFIGNSKAVKDLIEKVARVASTHSTVLIHGESGTGKELIARMVHDSSPRSAGPYVPVNCAAINETLLESELFGHEKGAFTGADQRRVGRFEKAHSGTIFLDEIGEMSLACQAKLLRLLEGHPFERVGGNDPIQVDVRIVAATHRKLPELVKDGRFREDLYYRLGVIELEIPALRERTEDIMEIAGYFLEETLKQVGILGAKQFARSTINAMNNYDWPGNVRRLKNAVERAVVLGTGDEITVEDLGIPDLGIKTSQQAVWVSLAEAELRHIKAVLEQVDGNKTKACEILKIGRGTLYKKLEEDRKANES